MIHVTWEKKDDYEPTLFYDDNGNEVEVNQGRSMIFIIRDDRDTFDIDGITYYPDVHTTLTAPVETPDDGATGAASEELSEEQQAGAEAAEEEW